MNRSWKRNHDHNWRVFEEAREYVRSLGLKGWDEWQGWASSGARSDDIPAHPDGIYRGMGWADMGDFRL